MTNSVSLPANQVLLEGQSLDIPVTLTANLVNAVINVTQISGPAGTLQTSQFTLSTTVPNGSIHFLSGTQSVSQDGVMGLQLTGGGSLAGTCSYDFQVPLLDVDGRDFYIDLRANTGTIWERDPATSSPTAFYVDAVFNHPPLAADGMGGGSMTLEINGAGFGFSGPVVLTAPAYVASFLVTPVDNANRDMDMHSVEVVVGMATTDPVWASRFPVGRTLPVVVEDDERWTFFSSAPHQGDLGTPMDMDMRCNMDGARPNGSNVFKALVTNGLSRCPACPDWAFTSGRHYLYSNGAELGRAAVDGTLPTLGFAGSGMTVEFWTGMNADWSTGAVCQLPANSAWTSSQGAQNGTYGRVTSVSASIGGNLTTCDSPKTVMCVEQ